MKSIVLVTAIIIAFSSAAAAQGKDTSHVSREAAIQLIRSEGIMSGKTRVVSASCGGDTHEWLITLRHPKGTLSAWFVDATGQNYHGGPCKH